MKTQLNRNEEILFQYERLNRNGAQIGRMFGISRQRVHQIVLRECEKQGRFPKWYEWKKKHD